MGSAQRFEGKRFPGWPLTTVRYIYICIYKQFGYYGLNFEIYP